MVKPVVCLHPGCKTGQSESFLGLVFLRGSSRFQGALDSCIVGTDVVPATVLNFEGMAFLRSVDAPAKVE